MIIIIDLDYKVNSIKVINWKSRQYQTPGRASRLLMTFLYLMLTYLEISGQQYTRTELSVFNGLGQGDVFSISQDSLGYIWITQQHGVARFNGREFFKFEANPADSTALPTTEVYHITHLPDGNAWFSHQKGLSFYHRIGNRFTNYNRSHGLHCDNIKSTIAEGDSILYAVHWYGYDRIRLKNFATEWIRPFPQLADSVLRHRSYNLPNHPKQNPFDANQLFSLHSNEIYVLDKTTLQFTKLTDFDLGRNPYLKSAFYLLEYEWADANTLLLNFFPNTGEIYSYDLSTKKLTPLPLFQEKSLWITKIEKTSNNTYLCLEQSLGPFWIKSGDGQTTLIDTTISGKTFGSVFQDRENVIWAGEHGYVFRYEPTQTVTYAAGPADYFLSHITDPKTGTSIFFSYTNSRVLQFENKKFKEISFPKINEFSANTFFHAERELFFNITGKTLTWFHPLTQVLREITLTGIGNTDNIHDFATTPEGFYTAVNNQVYFITVDGLCNSICSADEVIYELEHYREKLYYSTPGSVYEYNTLTGKRKEIFHLDGYTNLQILIHNDVLYLMWWDKLKYALLDSNEVSFIDSHLDVAFPDLSFMQLSTAGDDLLITAEFMMIRLETPSLRVKRTYSYLDQIYIGYWNDVFSTTKDHYYLTTDLKKIIAFPEQLSQPAFRSYQVERMEVNGQQKIMDEKTFKLRDDENNIIIKSDAVYTGLFDKLTYYYRNTTKGDNWLQMKSDVLQLLNQKPGKYSIDLKVVDRFGQEKILQEAAVFEISPPWYQRIWFYGVCLLFGIGVAYVAYQYRLKQVQKEYDFQSKLQQLEMTALKAQMNPHFIFNCLNSIKGLVLIGDSDKAVSYIGTFSKLVRSSLDSAEEKLLTLKEELDIAENYLTLEQLRYGPKLTWSIRCQDESLLTSIKLPPFILQPLLENAIVHGIKYVDHDGFIHILAYSEKSNVHIKIIDNGIGLQLSKAREQHNEHTTRKHLGVSLVERRLKIIDATLSIYDHLDDDGNISGTISEIIIPHHHE